MVKTSECNAPWCITHARPIARGLSSAAAAAMQNEGRAKICIVSCDAFVLPLWHWAHRSTVDTCASGVDFSIYFNKYFNLTARNEFRLRIFFVAFNGIRNFLRFGFSVEFCGQPIRWARVSGSERRERIHKGNPKIDLLKFQYGDVDASRMLTN